MLELSITKESILKNFKLLFKNYNEALATRFYEFLSKGYHMQRIYFDDYLVRLYGLANGSFVEKNYFAFCLYDADGDGVLAAQDIVTIHESVV